MDNATHDRRGERKPHDLYRLYDEGDKLLYVGISYSALGRLAQHRDSQPWAGEVRRMAVEPLGSVTRKQAEVIERQIIQREKPLRNVVHNGANRSTAVAPSSWERTAVDLDATWMTFDEFQAIAEAVQAVAQRLDNDERRGVAVPDRNEFIDTITAITQTAWMGDRCGQCRAKTYQPQYVERVTPTSVRAGYICSCWNVWNVWWAG